jgi:hypothetical protein
MRGRHGSRMCHCQVNTAPWYSVRNTEHEQQCTAAAMAANKHLHIALVRQVPAAVRELAAVRDEAPSSSEVALAYRATVLTVSA